MGWIIVVLGLSSPVWTSINWLIVEWLIDYLKICPMFLRAWLNLGAWAALWILIVWLIDWWLKIGPIIIVKVGGLGSPVWTLIDWLMIGWLRIDPIIFRAWLNYCKSWGLGQPCVDLDCSGPTLLNFPPKPPNPKLHPLQTPRKYSTFAWNKTFQILLLSNPTPTLGVASTLFLSHCPHPSPLWHSGDKNLKYEPDWMGCWRDGAKPEVKAWRVPGSLNF